MQKYMTWLKLLLSILGLLLAYFILLQVQLLSCVKEPPQRVQFSKFRLQPSVKIYDVQSSEEHLHIIKSLAVKLGYTLVGPESTSWEILWSHPYPFNYLRRSMAFLKPHQKVNHFPGSGIITQKMNLISIGIPHIPKAFVMPHERESFLNYSKEHPDKLWVTKSNSHRGIRVADVSELNLVDEGFFIQEFIEKPLLISGKKFDIGVYVVITSVDPLRVYAYMGDVLLRFCTVNYNPFNASNVESYVVGDDYLPVWQIPALSKFYTELNFTSKESLNSYLLLQKKNPQKLWSQVIEVLQEMFLKSEIELVEASYKLGHLRNFFELLRVDFTIDEDINVFLLEVNMSPNLSAAHFPQNQMLYEQVLFNVFSVVGLVRTFPDLIATRYEIEVSEKDVAVFLEECNSPACNNSCKIQKCKVCNFCMTHELTLVAKEAYKEHLNRNKLRRIIPFPINSKLSARRALKPTQLSEMNYFMDRWFKGKCLQDETFCQ